MNQQRPPFNDFFLSPLFHPQNSPLSQLSPLLSQYDQHNFTALEQLSELDLPGPCFTEEPIQDPMFALGQPPALGPENGALINNQRTEMPQASILEDKQEQQPNLELNATTQQSRVRQIIEFLIEHSQLEEERLELEGRRLSLGNAQLMEVFRILSLKFKGLRKTKEQMTKYCMRKAFKFIGQPALEGTGCDVEEGMQQYFSANGGQSFSFPFKKHSIDKTMNGAFLARVFANQKFGRDYLRFLDRFEALTAEDNQRKVDYLCEQVNNAVKNGDLALLQVIKRVPWTKRILNQLKQLAAELPEQPKEGRARRPVKQRFV